jgi:hypothetical protein
MANGLIMVTISSATMNASKRARVVIRDPAGTRGILAGT